MHHPTQNITLLARGTCWAAIDKPPGVLSVPGKGPENALSCASWARERFPDATGPITVHRLDMDTSGILLLALNAGAHRELSMQFERREIDKEYVAIVQGHLSAERGLIDAPMRADVDRRPYQIIDLDRGSPSQTLYRLLAYEPDRSRVALTPLTGRTHQLRVHCAHIGHPIVGDVLYSSNANDEVPSAAPSLALDSATDGVYTPSAERLMLHARRVVFTDPSTGTRVEISSTPPF